MRISHFTKKTKGMRMLLPLICTALIFGLTLCGCEGKDSAGTNSSGMESDVDTADLSQTASSSDTMSSSENAAGSDTESTSKTSGDSNVANSSESETTSETEIISSDSALNVRAKKSNSWESDKAAFAQYELNISNNSGHKITDWSASLCVPKGTELSQSWNCTAVCTDGKLSVKCVDYNSSIDTQTDYHDTGLIISCKDDIPEICAGSVFSYKMDGKSYTCNISDTGKESEDQEKSSVTDESADSKSKSGTQSESESKSVKGVNAGEDKNSMNTEFKVTPLKVVGTDLTDADGDKVQLKGISSHALALYPQYVNEDSLRTLRDEWHANVFRLAMYTMEDGGYCNGGDQKKLEQSIDTAVKACQKLNMYVIIDWHILSDGNPLTHEKEAEVFFEKMSKKYAGIPNVIYEICNEPNNSDWKTQIRPYADDIIPIIRKNDKNVVILVGTNTWSQDVDQVATDPLKYDNIMYSLHFYAGTHKEQLRLKAVNAIKAGTPVFISECSICTADGNGAADTESGNDWMDLIYKYNLSYIEWNLSNKAESSAMLKPSCTKTSGYTDDDLTEIGKWYKDVMSTR